MRKFIKLIDVQAKKLGGIYNGTALDPRFIDIGFNITALPGEISGELGIVRRYLNKLTGSGDAKIIDMSAASDPDVIKLKEVFEETLEGSSTRIKKRVTKWDYLKKEINTEL